MEVEESRIAAMKQFLVELRSCNVSPSSDDNQVRSCAVGSYFVNLEDVEGEVLNWSLQYLEQRKCPTILALAVSKCVAEQLMKHENKFIIQNTGPEGSIDAGCLHRETMKHLHDLCDHWREHPDELLKCTADVKEDPYFTSVCTIKNGRRKMEDRYTIIHNLNLLCGLKDAPHHSYYGVFDGHAGTRAASYAAAHLHSNIAHHPAFLSDPELAIKEGFKITDKQILERSKKENTKSGCTVVCSFLNEKALHVAWVGDSQAILVRQGVPYIITKPHKPDRKDERQRIEDLNGYVLFIGTWRVNGTLAVSRALGDPEHKPYVCAEPDVVSIPLEGNEDFFVLACDGLWDRLNPSDVASAIYSHIVEHPPSDYEEVASRLVLQAKENGSADNITAIVVFLKDPEELAANPKNPPPYSLQLNGSKVDSWCQGSWNGTHNSSSEQYIFPEEHTKCAVKPSSLGDLSKSSEIADLCNMENFQFNPVTCEAGGSFETDESKNCCHSGVNSVMPETTAFSELPTPPIDELLANQQFGEHSKLVDMADTLVIESETTEIKSSSGVTLADSGILEQDYPQVDKNVDSIAQNSNDESPFLSSDDHKDALLSSDTAVEMASEIVNNAIELAVTQVMVRTSSQMSQHFDDSGLEEEPMEESDVSPVSASPECEAKHNDESQELISFDGEESVALKSEVDVKSECFLNGHEDSGQQDGIKGTELFSETDFLQAQNTETVDTNEKSSASHSNEDVLCLSNLNYDAIDSDQLQGNTPNIYAVQKDDQLQDDINNVSAQGGIEVHPHPLPGNLDLTEDVALEKKSSQLLASATSTASIEVPPHTPAGNLLDLTEDVALNENSQQLLASVALTASIEISPHPPAENLHDLKEDVALNENSPQLLVPTISTTFQHKEKNAEQSVATMPLEKSNAISELPESIIRNDTQSLTPLHNDNLIQPDENTEASLSSSLLHSDVGQLFEQLAHEENKTLPAELSNSLSEELQSGVTPIDLVTIPDEVPEAEGVTEDADSDSEKDGGWSYIQGSKTDLPKQQKAESAASVDANNVKAVSKKPLNKSIKKELAKPVTEIRTSQLKPNTLSRKKTLPEKNENKVPPGTLKATRMPKTTLTTDKAKKPSSAPLKTASQTEKQGGTMLRPKSSVTSNSRLQSAKPNPAISQKAATAIPAAAKQQKPPERKVTSTAQITSAAATNTVRTMTRTQKLASKPAVQTTQKVAPKTGTSQVRQAGSATQTKTHMQPTKELASNKLVLKSVQDAKQTKETANKQISSQPSTVQKTRMPTSSRTPASHNTLPSRDIPKSATSKQPIGSSKALASKTTKPFSAAKSTSIRNSVKPPSTAKVANVKSTSKEKPHSLTHQLSEQEKGTKEELTKEIVANENPSAEGFLKQENNKDVYIPETRLENEAISN